MSGTGVTAAKRIGSILGYVAMYVLIWAGVFMLVTGIGIRMLWGPISVDQMLMNLVATDTDGGGGSLVITGVLAFGVLPVLITLGVGFFHYRHVRKVRTRSARTSADEAEDDSTRVRTLGPRWVTRTVSAVMVTAVVVVGSTAFSSSVHVGEYIKAVNSEYTIDQYYTAPQVESAEGKRNLVTIYLESGEETLSDTTLFEKDPYIPLKDATSQDDGWQSVDDFQQYEGGGWTMSGLASTQCGIPLKGNGIVTGKSGLNSLGGDLGDYLGGLTCSGDIFADEGYKNVFMGGANGSFAAKDQFLSDHGYDELYDLNYWRAQGEPDNQFRDDWGLSDNRLMANAKDKVDELHAESEETGQPFNLSMLTVDTHEPVHIYDYCNVDTEEELISAYQCSMEQVAGFVDHMEAQGYLDDTAVVIMGDHLKHMGSSNAFGDELGDNPNRTIFNRVWVPGDDKFTSTMRNGVDQVNMMPTILEAAGIRLQGREAGLGVSAFSDKIPAGSAQSLDPDVYRELLGSRSAEFYSDAWEGEVLQ
ncbi:LTA synthase family protein [Corynebacterium sp. AOP40-9SA-29]|uniref:LTA synthase family protein n=1 Tax=Corynebacterium sp. AOP40-9SA-29 TaxID=3457677 RepID=UPI004034256A